MMQVKCFDTIGAQCWDGEVAREKKIGYRFKESICDI